RLDGWTMIVYPFIDGDTSWTGMTSEQWKEVGTTLRQIHQVTLPPSGFEPLHKETFDPTGYAQWIRSFEPQQEHARFRDSAAERTLRSLWMEHQSTIHTAVASLEKLGGELQRQALPYVVCHADLHPANLLRDQAGHVFVIDWDEVMLAPKERDFIYVREPHAAAFFEGYGQAEIDWTALTYYLWERVVQDLIECARSVCFRDDWTEEPRTDATQLFQSILTGEESDIAAANAAATHLPSDLVVHPEKNP
ncbi:MAG: aminoglycoside phosphotransferase family protein, partial [Ktedonobacteraceae bacterium]|nr:aminoglycoside phosphotransferase family protein [Ktedonobacteraceae bacterium]